MWAARPRGAAICAAGHEFYGQPLCNMSGRPVVDRRRDTPIIGRRGRQALGARPRVFTLETMKRELPQLRAVG